MILIASPQPGLARACRQVLSPFYSLYDRDVSDLNSLFICLKKTSVDVLIIDFALLGAHEMTEIQTLIELSPKSHVIIFTDQFKEREQLTAILFGAKAYCDTKKDIPLLPKIVKTVLTNELWVDRKFLTRLLAEIEDITSLKRRESVSIEEGLSKMTPREKEIAKWVGQGASNRKISEVLDISESTVKAHLGVIFRKLGIHDRLQLAIYMNRHQQMSAIWHTNKKSE